jgi:type IV secretory pathway TrbL component
VAPPVVTLWDWLPAALDPVLILVAVWLGWKADQVGKVLIAVIAALGISVLVSWVIAGIGLPWIAPVRSDALTLFPVRVIAALLWAGGAYSIRRVMRRH